MFLRRFNHGKGMEQTQLLSMKPFFEIPRSVHQFSYRLHAKFKHAVTINPKLGRQLIFHEGCYSLKGYQIPAENLYKITF